MKVRGQRRYGVLQSWLKSDSAGVSPLNQSVRPDGKFLYNQWEVGADKLAIRNPAWNGFVQRIAVKAVGDLGIELEGGVVEAIMDRAWIWAVGACRLSYSANYECVNWLYLYCFLR